MVETTSRRPGRRRSAAVLLAVALAAVTASGSAAERPTDGTAASVALSAEVSPASALLKERAESAGTSSRGAARAAAAEPAAPAASQPTATVGQAPPEPPPQVQPRAVEAGASPAPPPPPPKPAPVGGLTQRQMDHAAVIVAMGQRAGLPERAYVVAIATALQESNLRNLANPVYPESLNLPNDGTGYDHDSVGLFQQRPSTGWGSVSQIMDPAYAATKFYEALARVPGWEDMAITVAAQRVQVSAFPDAYAKHELRARQIVAALT
jgi:hypothetical protein